jgi:hypothetical protein
MHEGLFHILFAEIVQITLQKSIPDNSNSIEPDQELAFYQIERIGFQVGQRLIDRLVLGHRTFNDQLDAFKFICKDYWNVLFRKSIDNLKTNHKVSPYISKFYSQLLQGVYVLHDASFPWISKFALDISMPDTAKMAVLVSG